MNKDIEILNGLLNKIGVKGFSFVREWDFNSLPYFTIAVSYIESVKCNRPYTSFGVWRDMHDLFNDYKRHIPQGDLKSLISNVLESRKHYSNISYTVNYLGVNDVGLDFLRCLINCNSLEELKLRLAIQGY
jgi:hypothetical protein